MKFSCELDSIFYIIETEIGRETDFKFIMFLDDARRKLLKNDQMKFHTLKIKANKGDLELNFEVQGVPLNIDEEIQLEEVEDFFEGQNLFQKIEDLFTLDLKDDPRPNWAKN